MKLFILGVHPIFTRIVDGVGDGLEILWPLILGFGLSAVVQAVAIPTRPPVEIGCCRFRPSSLGQVGNLRLGPGRPPLI